MIVPQQARGARAMLKWTVAELAERATVAPNTVVRFEADKSVNTGTVAAIQRALEAAGVEFLPDNGVRLHAGAKSALALPGADQTEKSSVASPASSRQPSGQSGHTDQAAENGTLKPRRPRAKPLAMSKEAQIRALRERNR